MNGSVRRRGAGWEYYYRELNSGTGKWRQRSKGGFASRREAEAGLRSVLSRMDTGNYVSPSGLSLDDYLTHRWLPSIKTTIRASTHASYSRIVRLHIVPRLGAVKLQALDPMMLNEFYGALLREGRVDRPGPLSVRSVRYVHAVLHRALRDAMRWQLLTRNVTEAADPPKQNTVMRPLMRTWSAETLREFLTACEGDRKQPAWLLLARTGMRRGEVLGLSWDDVDLETAQLAARLAPASVGGQVGARPGVRR
jgi:integrase